MDKPNHAALGHMSKHPQNRWGTVRYDARFDVYWVTAGGAKQRLFYCPWCVERLPPSQRDRWFDELEARDIDPSENDIPEEFKTGAWRGAILEQPAEYDGGPIEGRYIDFFDPPSDDIDE